MAKSPMVTTTYSIPEDVRPTVISNRTGVLSDAESVLCLSIGRDPDYQPTVARINSAIDFGKHGCALLATEISDGFKLFLTRNGFIVNEWIVLNDPKRKGVYISWDGVSRVVTYDSYNDVERENTHDDFNLGDLPF